MYIYSNSQIEKSWKPGNHGGDIIYDKLEMCVSFWECLSFVCRA